MKMVELANLLLATAQVHGNREVTLVEEGTGEVRYVEAISFDSTGDNIMLEHIDYEEKKMVDYFNALEEVDPDAMTYETASAVVPLEIMEIFKILAE